MSHCGVLDLHNLLGKKWTYGLLFNIGNTPVTYTDLEAMTNKEINPTLLSERLSDLIKFGLIEKKMNNGRMSYHLTAHGGKIKELLIELKNTAEKYAPVPETCAGGNCEHCSAFNIAKLRFETEL